MLGNGDESWRKSAEKETLETKGQALGHWHEMFLPFYLILS